MNYSLPPKMNEQAIGRVQKIVDAAGIVSRRELSRRVCESLSWKGKGGRLAVMSCRKRLVDLERRGLLQLPPPGKAVPARSKPGGDDTVLAGLTPFSGPFSTMGPIELVLIEQGDRALSRVFNALLDRYHPRGSGPLCGAQLRYLFRCKRYGWLGGISFSAAAWRLYARDASIGWDERARRIHLPKVLNNSRFLIRPDIQARNLASHVLGQVVKRVAVDFKARYGYKPVLLETFVECEKHDGACYKAANWQYVGQSAGRGRQDQTHQAPESVKDIYLYPLREDWQSHLTRVPARVLKEERLECPPTDWAEEEFGNVELGDERLKERLLDLARSFYAAPESNIPAACGSAAATKAAYRFFDHEATELQTLLAPHFEATLTRIVEHPVVLAVQDTTSLNYSAHPATNGLGPLNTSEDKSIGLHLHDTMAFDPLGTPLGLVDIQVWAREPGRYDKSETCHERPIEDKESYKWLKSYQAASEAQRRCPETMVVSVGDREADVYELFELAHQTKGGAKLLVRANQDRVLTDDTHLWDFVSKLPEVGKQEVHVPRRGARLARTATLSVRFSPIILRPPKLKKHKKPLSLWVVYAVELDPPKEVKEPLKWLLFTTVETLSFEDALVRLKWYTKRWGIEIFHRTLKSGCKVEDRQLEDADRLQSCLAIDLVVAWRIFYLTMLGRETPNVPCTVFFEEAEWKALVAYRTHNPIAPENPPTLREAIRMVAQIGGFLGRKRDGEPGTTTIWRGITALDFITSIWIVMAGQKQPKYRLRC
jgi:hypothetical protein